MDEQGDTASTRTTGGDRAPKSFAGWLAVTCAVSFVGAALPLIWNPRFYYYDDTASGAFGIWFKIGQTLRAGEWPLFSNEAWMAGNYAAEGQWGIWNPLILLIGLLASFATNALIFATAVKIIALVVLAAGTFLLTRGYGASDALSSSAGLAVALSGFTVYMDAPSWVTGLFVFSLLPWVLWSGRALAFHRMNPIFPFVFGYLLITIGYVHGTIMLVIALGGLLVEALLSGRRGAARSVFGLGIVLGLVALATYLPGVLTASVSSRESEILNSGFLATDLTGLATSFVGSATPQVSAWWGFFAPVPLLFSTWMLPTLCFVDFRRALGAMRSGAALLTLLVVATALTLAPSDLGPLRFPVRLAPYLALALIVLVHILLSRYRVDHVSRTRIRLASLVFVAALYLAFTQLPENFGLHLGFLLIAALGTLCVGWVINRGGLLGHRPTDRRVLIAAVAIVITLATALLQRQTFPSSPLPDYHLPNDVASYSSPLETVSGATFVVGVPTELPPDIWEETLFANTWYLSGATSHNLYSPVQFENYAVDLCMDSHGWTCQGALGTLFTPDPEDGTLPVDLLALNAVQILRAGDDEYGVELRAKEVPDGWRETWSSDDSRIWERVGPPAVTGGVVSADNATVAVVEQSETRVVLDVENVGTGGGEAILSRLAWPGYSVTGDAALGQPLRGYLLRVDLPATSEKQTVVIEFRPPGWLVVITSLALGVLGASCWSVLHLWQRRRNPLVAASAARAATRP